MRTTNATDLRNNLKKYLDAVINDSDTVIINRDGGTGAVLISLDEYNAIKETEYIMSSSAMMKAIKDGEQEIADGKGVRIRSIKDLEEFANNEIRRYIIKYCARGFAILQTQRPRQL